MAYDANHAATVLFGGDGAGNMGITWSWDWSNSTWIQKATTGPSARAYAGVAYDSVRGLVLLVGGLTSSGATSETWKWDGLHWTFVPEAGLAARSYTQAAFDADLGRTFLFGGVDSDGNHLGDTWALPGLVITQQPLSIAVSVGEIAHFQVQTAGFTGNLNYQWWKNDAIICDNGRVSGVHTNTMTIDPVILADARDYRVTVYAANSYVTTVPATLSVFGRGDMNCDGVVNFDDIDPFVQAVADPVAWQAAYPNCPLSNGDVNYDGAVDFADIDAFVALLTGG